MREVVLEYTQTRCGSCGAAERRYYREGDALFAAAGKCPCGGEASVEAVYAETHRL